MKLGRSLEGQVGRIAVRLLKLDRQQKRLIVIAADMILCVIAIFLAFSLRVGALAFPIQPPLLFAALALPVFLIVFLYRRTYRSILRFSGARTIMRIAATTVIYSLPIIAAFSVNHVPGIPRTIAILQPIILLGLLAASRIAARYALLDLANAHGFTGGTKGVLIYGAGGAGQQLVAQSRHEPGMSILGFVDDDIRLKGQVLDGIEVFHSDDLGRIIDGGQAETILLAMPNLSQQRRAEIFKMLREFSIHVQTLPNFRQLVDGQASLSDLREIQIEDLLGRDEVAPDGLLLGKTVYGKTVLVSGAGGSIGSELCRQIIGQHPKRLILAEMTEHALYQIEVELTRIAQTKPGPPVELVAELMTFVDREATGRLFDRWQPDTVFHAAAYKHVPLVEANVVSGMRNNIIGTMNAAHAAANAGVDRFILISTDKAVRPTNVMGASKRVCELVLQALAQTNTKTRFAMVRFGNVLGSSGSVVPRFQQQIRSGGPVTLTHRDVTRYFMTIPEAAQLVIQAGTLAEGGEVFLLDMGEPVRIYDLARTMIDLSGLTAVDEENPDGNITIEEIGLRPGEKLYEELLIDSDSEATRHPRINRAREDALSPAELDAKLAPLLDALYCGEGGAAVRYLSALVPEYKGEKNAHLNAA